MLTQKEKELADRILTDYLFSEDPNVFDQILCDDEAYRILSDENIVEEFRKYLES
jgi:hypothetical protein